MIGIDLAAGPLIFAGAAYGDMAANEPANGNAATQANRARPDEDAAISAQVDSPSNRMSVLFDPLLVPNQARRAQRYSGGVSWSAVPLYSAGLAIPPRPPDGRSRQDPEHVRNRCPRRPRWDSVIAGRRPVSVQQVNGLRSRVRRFGLPRASGWL